MRDGRRCIGQRSVEPVEGVCRPSRTFDGGGGQGDLRFSSNPHYLNSGSKILKYSLHRVFHLQKLAILKVTYKVP